MGVFDSLLNPDQQKSPVDVLNSLINPENIAMKTDLNISQIRVLTRAHYVMHRLKNPKEDPMESLEVTLDYYKQLMVSLKRKSREEVIKGLSDMRPELFEPEMLGQALMGGMKK